MTKEALVVVAHPDDETIWMGGTILSHPDYHWTIVSLCRKGDQDREPKFFKVCEALGAKGIIGNLDDDILAPLSEEVVSAKILELVPKKSWDIIYTHGANGEYGHLRHKECHRSMCALVKSGTLSTSELLVFSYAQGERYVPNNTDLNLMECKKGADKHVVLSEEIFKRKVALIRRMYGFGEDTFEVVTVQHGEEEAFDQMSF